MLKGCTNEAKLFEEVVNMNLTADQTQVIRSLMKDWLLGWLVGWLAFLVPCFC